MRFARSRPSFSHLILHPSRSFRRSHIPRPLLGIHMPDHIIRQPIHAIPCTLRHLCKTLRLGLILKRIRGEIDAGAMHIRLNEDIDAADAVERHLLVLVGVPVAHDGHVLAVRGELLVAFCEDDGFGERGGECEALGGFLPGVVVDWEGVSGCLFCKGVKRGNVQRPSRSMTLPPCTS
jgi:hypothetical protein